MKHYIRLIRPTQWIKNLFVFGPVIFGGRLLDAQAMSAAFITFWVFCFAASSIYCLNDIIDVPDDRRHPVKCTRPIASGAVSLRQAYVLMLLMLALSACCVVALVPLYSMFSSCPPSSLRSCLSVGAVALFYVALNITYCVKLKQYAIIDVCLVAFGFVLRLMAGGLATGITLSKWIVLMTFLLTLFMSFAKRRDDVIRMETTGEPPRKNTIHYNLTFINQAITITAAVTLVCYIMYTISPEVIAQFGNENLYLTSVFVLVGLLRYIQIAVVEKKSGNPTKVILKDRFVQLVVAAWFVAFILIIYVF
ncbi:decaprenyl-phosphate phosphoribosyltransferase [Hallella colorans]|uniref:decaprenyl-phosphate phosphoribosyltransferase n=1 Tax=Hallella colorans TaxID=1703337 RepID=UPI0023EFD28C|nr:decaprenyl-phosphate phosphoribosyltransferase [Hallella colorans]